MSLILSGTDGLSDVDGSAATPAIRGTDANTGIFFPAADTIAFSEGGVESMRIDSSGNVGIGTSSLAGYRVSVKQSGNTSLASVGIASINSANDTYIGMGYNATSDTCRIIASYDSGGAFKPLTFLTSDAERMRIDTSGNLLVGTSSSAYGKLEVKINASGAGGAARFINDASSGYTGELVQMISTQGASTAYNILSCYYSGGAAYAFRVRGDGVLFAQNTTVQSASDLRFKQNITNATDGLDVVSALRPVRYDLIEGNGITGRTNQLGFIAQEVKEVFPDAVDIWGESEDPINPYLSLGTTTLIPVLVKAIQEQQTLITALTARITALETP